MQEHITLEQAALMELQGAEERLARAQQKLSEYQLAHAEDACELEMVTCELDESTPTPRWAR